MCGIAGYICMDTKRPNKTKLEEMFSSIEMRGKDAAGIAYPEGSHIKVFKAPFKATELITKKGWRKLETLPPIMIFHTRASTQGDPLVNSNNHPITYESYAMAHNGVITNEADFDVDDKTVDSLAILKSWHKNDKDIKKVFASLEGSFAVALIDHKTPNKLTLFRHNNPIEMLLDIDDSILYFASTVWAVEKNKQEYSKVFKNIPLKNRYATINFPDNSYIEVTTDDGLVNTIYDLKAKERVWTYTNGKYSSRKRNNNFAFDSEDYDDIDAEYYNSYQSQCRIPFTTASKTEDKAKTPKIEDDTAQLFLENALPKTEEEYAAINTLFATSHYFVRPCPVCSKTTLTIKTQTTHKCQQCSVIFNTGNNYVN